MFACFSVFRPLYTRPGKGGAGVGEKTRALLSGTVFVTNLPDDCDSTYQKSAHVGPIAPVTSLLGIFPKERTSDERKGFCTGVSTAGLHVIARTGAGPSVEQRRTAPAAVRFPGEGLCSQPE